VLRRGVVTASPMDGIRFRSEGQQLMLLGQQRGKVRDNLIYGTEGFWGNLYAAYSESGASSGSLRKRGLVIPRSRDTEIP